MASSGATSRVTLGCKAKEPNNGVTEPGPAECQPSSNTTGTITFTSPDELFDLLESPRLAIASPSEPSFIDDFRAIESLRNSRCRDFRLFYEGQERILVITLPTQSHEGRLRFHVAFTRHANRWRFDVFALSSGWSILGSYKRLRDGLLKSLGCHC